MERIGALLLVIAALQGAVLSVNVEVFPAEAVVSVGQNVSMLCRVSVPIQYCRIEVPGLEAPLNLNPLRGPTPPSNAAYLGEGLEKGHCGVSIPRVEDKYNGVFKCSVGTPTEAHESQGSMTVIVARAPATAPTLDLTRPRDPQDTYQEFERVLATCTVPDARPAANISWFIGDDPVTEGLSVPQIFENAKDKLYSVRQNLTRELRWSDNGKELRCVASNPVLGTDPIRTTGRRKISVKFAPRPAAGDLEQFGFIEGEEGVVAIRIKAHPKPSFLWTVGREDIYEGNSSPDSERHFEVAYTEPKGPGEWETKLTIRPVTKEDVDREYRVQATNTIGQQDYVVRISTSSQPRAMAEMGAGAIVGIVIAVLLVLLIIFIVVFARATGRWCFAAGGGRGKSSQTSSVAHIDPEGHSEKAKHAGVGGTENPSINHNVSSEYINGNDIKKEIKEDTPV